MFVIKYEKYRGNEKIKIRMLNNPIFAFLTALPTSKLLFMNNLKKKL